MKRLRTVLVLVSVLAVLATGCAPEPTETPTPKPTFPPFPAEQFATVPVPQVQELTTSTTNDEIRHVHAIVPQIAGDEVLNTTLSDFAAAQVAEYDQVMGDKAGRGFVTVGWETLGSAQSLVGFLLRSETNTGASTGVAVRSVWYDVTAKQVLGLHDLLTDEGVATVTREVTASLRAHDPDPDISAATAAIADGTVAVGFDHSGALLIGFDSHQIVSGSAGAPVIAVSADPQTVLTDAGMAARTAAMEPAELVLAPPPPPPLAPVDCAATACVALTFDDGPSAATTPRLLDILKQKGVHATFFVLGSQVQAHPALLIREYQEGHEIGNHSWSHPQLTKLSTAQVRAQILDTAHLVQKVIGVAPSWVRAPYGARNADVDAVIKEAGYGQALWSVDTRDWQHHDPAKTLAAAAQAKPGAIVLMHDIHATTVDAVANVIDALHAKGYTLVTVSQLLGTAQPGAVHFGKY